MDGDKFAQLKGVLRQVTLERTLAFPFIYNWETIFDRSLKTMNRQEVLAKVVLMVVDKWVEGLKSREGPYGERINPTLWERGGRCRAIMGATCRIALFGAY